MNRQVISARGISKVFYNQNSSLEVLKDISFDLDKGQSIGIVGASGSGKTTLLHIAVSYTHLTLPTTHDV